MSNSASIYSTAVAQDNGVDSFFPSISCPLKPLGNRVLVQIRKPKNKTASGLYLTSDTKDDNYRQEQTAKVVSLGSGCFKFPTTGDIWPSGEWYNVGDYVRVPLHGGDNHWISYKDSDGKEELLLFKTFKDFEIISLIDGDPLAVKTNLAYF